MQNQETRSKPRMTEKTVRKEKDQIHAKLIAFKNLASRGCNIIKPNQYSRQGTLHFIVWGLLMSFKALAAH